MKLRYFSWVREKIGTEEEQVTGSYPSLMALLDALENRPRKGPIFGSIEKICVAVNGTVIEPSKYSTQKIHDTDEISIFPPVSGG